MKNANVTMLMEKARTGNLEDRVIGSCPFCAQHVAAEIFSDE